MGQKRGAPVGIQYILNVDKKLSKGLVCFLDKKFDLMKANKYMKGLEISCHGIIWLIGIATLIFLIDEPYIRQITVNIFIALIFDIVVVAGVKAIARRRRPVSNEDEMFATIAIVDKFSFPSGHATRATMLALLSFYQNHFILFSMALSGWALAISMSRVLLRRHHLFDVLAGNVIGFLEAVTVNYFWLAPKSCSNIVGYFMDETYVGASYDV